MEVDELYEQGKPASEIMSYMKKCILEIRQYKDEIITAETRLNPNKKQEKSKMQDRGLFF